MRIAADKTSVRRTPAAIVLLLAICLPTGSLCAQSVEDRLLKTTNAGKADDGGGSWPRVILSLAAIAGLIFLARHLLRRAGNSSRILGRSHAMEVLARTSVSMKHQMVLVRMGRRVLMVGLGPQGMSTLCELTDSQEIAQVLETLHKGGGDDFLRKVQEKSVEFKSASAPVEPQPGSLRRLTDKLQHELSEDRP